jgi:hypothetical protein
MTCEIQISDLVQVFPLVSMLLIRQYLRHIHHRRGSVYKIKLLSISQKLERFPYCLSRPIGTHFPLKNKNLANPNRSDWRG